GGRGSTKRVLADARLLVGGPRFVFRASDREGKKPALERPPEGGADGLPLGGEVGEGGGPPQGADLRVCWGGRHRPAPPPPTAVRGSHFVHRLAPWITRTGSPDRRQASLRRSATFRWDQGDAARSRGRTASCARGSEPPCHCRRGRRRRSRRPCGRSGWRSRAACR